MPLLSSNEAHPQKTGQQRHRKPPRPRTQNATRHPETGHHRYTNAIAERGRAKHDLASILDPVRGERRALRDVPAGRGAGRPEVPICHHGRAGLVSAVSRAQFVLASHV